MSPADDPTAAPAADAPAVSPPAEQPPVAAPAAETPPAEAASTTDAPASDAPAAEAPASEEAPAARPDLLRDARVPGTEEAPKEEAAGDQPEKTAAEEKPAEATKEGDQPTEPEPKAEEGKLDAPEAAPVELEAIDYKYELPETMQMDDAFRGRFHEAADAVRRDPANLQPLIDLHTEAMTNLAQTLGKQASDYQHDAWAKTLDTWRTEAMSDPVIGGAHHQTAMGAIAMVRDRFISDHVEGTDGWKADMAAFDHMLNSTGVGNHPTMLRFMHRISRFIGEPSVPKHGEVNVPVDRTTRNGGSPLHDNPRSRQLNGRR